MLRKFLQFFAWSRPWDVNYVRRKRSWWDQDWKVKSCIFLCLVSHEGQGLYILVSLESDERLLFSITQIFNKFFEYKNLRLFRSQNKFVVDLTKRAEVKWKWKQYFVNMRDVLPLYLHPNSFLKNHLENAKQSSLVQEPSSSWEKDQRINIQKL